MIVEEPVRDNGVGAALCTALETRARDAGIERLSLLTTTATAFFADRGYRELPRSDAPQAIREATEFASLCPDSAVCLARSLADER